MRAGKGLQGRKPLTAFRGGTARKNIYRDDSVNGTSRRECAPSLTVIFFVHNEEAIYRHGAGVPVWPKRKVKTSYTGHLKHTLHRIYGDG